MALMMVHLLVADLWAQGHPEYLDSPEYYLGAISPDAIHIRFHDDKSRKDEFHLYNWQSLHREPVEAYWRERRQPFDIGYGVHVLTDCQWVQRYRRTFPGIFLPDGKIAATAKIHYICLKIDSELSEEEQNRDTKPVETELEEVYF